MRQTDELPEIGVSCERMRHEEDQHDAIRPSIEFSCSQRDLILFRPVK